MSNNQRRRALFNVSDGIGPVGYFRDDEDITLCSLGLGLPTEAPGRSISRLYFFLNGIMSLLRFHHHLVERFLSREELVEPDLALLQGNDLADVGIDLDPP